jgi:tRNA (cmo5U34)-methyltransferase
MMDKPRALDRYDHAQMAARYERTGGFAPGHKRRLHDVVCRLLLAAVPPHSKLLELGAGTGSFTTRLVAAHHFDQIVITDGAPAMLDVARTKLQGSDTMLQFEVVDLESTWTDAFVASPYDAVTSTIAIHHVQNKQRLFAQVLRTLRPGGLFIFGDHVDGSTSLTHYLVGRERALVRLGRNASVTEAQVRRAIAIDDQHQIGEGNRCETVDRYVVYLSASGFQDVDCLWRDFWLAAFVARKPD